jgi:aryl-alcohol dehydrogenase-like predicted oxidoreductase
VRVRYTRLGRSGPRVSVVGLGFWQAGGRSWRSPSGGEWVHRVVGAAVEYGIIFFDTAEIYGWGRSERLLGEAVRSLGVREEVIVASKLGGFRVNYWLMRRGIEAINRRLGFRVDLIQHHWPPPYWIPLCTVVRALERLVLEGRAAYYGLSNYPASLMEKAFECARRIEPVSDQVQYSLAYRSPENRLLPHSRERGYTLIAWSPLAKAALAGVSRPSDPAQKTDPVYRAVARDSELQDALDHVAAKHGATRAQVALAWLIAKGAVPIPGTRRKERVAEIAGAADLDLDNEDIGLLDRASSRYLTKWGRTYRALWYMRLIPATFQALALFALRGV